MKKIPIILTLILIAAWGYTSWYWYVCNIKGLCDASTYKQTEDIVNSDSRGGEDSNSPLNGASILTADDVLKGDTINDTPKQELEGEVQEENISEDTEEELREDEIMNSTGSINEEQRELVTDVTDICDEPLIGPITFGGNNNVEEVKKLESFLISRGENVTQDGVYGQDALDAVKKFQLEFKSEVLDPWGITTPTGYVGRTTIQKINEIACK